MYQEVAESTGWHFGTFVLLFLRVSRNLRIIMIQSWIG
jgi:hypothetical protein